MQTSHQAAGRLSAPRDINFPFRVVVLIEINGEWKRYAVFEEITAERADAEGSLFAIGMMDDFGVTDAHYYVGEVA